MDLILMERLRILRLNPEDDRLKSFRNQVLSRDLNVDPTLVNSLAKRQKILAFFSKHNDAEEIYKFSETKWSQVGFDEVLGVEFEGSIVSIAGNKRYANGVMRLGMHYYTLKKFRTTIRSVLWRQGGFIDESLRYHPNASAFFISIYAHNKKLQSWVRKLKQGNQFAQMAVANKEITNRLRNFTPAGTIIFNGVPQLILYHSPQNTEMPKNFLEQLGVSF